MCRFNGEALPKVPGIGADLDGEIHEIATTGHLPALERQETD